MYILVAGSGKTSRSNLEALIADFISGQENRDPILLLPAFNGGFTPAQEYAAQYFEHLGLRVSEMIYKDDDLTVGVAKLVTVEVDEDKDMLEQAMGFLKNQSKGVLILWNDDDQLSLSLLEQASKHGIEACDLTSGLIALTPVMPSETPPVNMPEEEMCDDDDDDDFDDDDDCDGDHGIHIFSLDEDYINKIAEIFAKAIAKELKDLLK